LGKFHEYKQRQSGVHQRSSAQEYSRTHEHRVRKLLRALQRDYL
jgi:hypothetical protein